MSLSRENVRVECSAILSVGLRELVDWFRAAGIV